MVKRPPVVAVLGHVDHGKTSLLDWLRKTKVAEKEAGGITQGIGAYEVLHASTGDREEEKITFIDTPGHEAFKAMRQRGATVADMAVLVLAADEGVKSQTEECLEILKETETPYLIAVSKIDLPKANVEKIKNDLLSRGVRLEGYGGDISWQSISSKTGEGINELLDLILLLRDVLGLKYNSQINGRGFVIESKKDPQRGIVASVILKDGTLQKGNNILTPTVSGKIKILENFVGQAVEGLLPSSPALIIGFEGSPQVGEKFMSGDITVWELDKKEAQSPSAAALLQAESLVEEITDMPSVILRTDVAGSVEALTGILQNKVKILGVGPGEITDGDVKLAVASGAIIIGFRTKFSRGADVLAKNHNVSVFLSDIIYELDKMVKDYLESKRQPETAGRLKVLAVFDVKAAERQIIGGRVLEGKIRVGQKIEIERNNIALGSGKIINLQVNREDIQEASEGEECGLLIKASAIIKVGDEISQRAIK